MPRSVLCKFRKVDERVRVSFQDVQQAVATPVRVASGMFNLIRKVCGQRFIAIVLSS